MYTPVKDKFVYQSPTRHRIWRRIVPRYTKAYVWLSFLIFIFGYMLFLDNGIQPFSLLPRLGSIPQSRVNTTIPYRGGHHPESAVHHVRPTGTASHNLGIEKPASMLMYGSGNNAFSPEDVVILFKTGATSLWRRVPIHLSTSFSNKMITPNVIFYSDQADKIADYPIVDVLANVSSTLKSTKDFELYHTLKTIRSQNLYLESTQIDGDHYLGGGWRLDKYKFLPLMAHAATNYPNKKWYIYMEDDNYFFWHSLYSWLSTFDPSTPLFLGSPAARLGEDFAHGGSGFIVSNAAMSQTFLANPSLATDNEPYAASHCCGDQVLSHIMSVSGVPRDRRYDHTGWAGLQALPHWKMAFGHWNWCSPLFNVHKTHQSDISQLWSLEKQFQDCHGTTAVMTWGALFNLTLADVVAYGPSRKVEWDNGANDEWYRSTEADQALSEAERSSKPWFDIDQCERACREWHMCLSWKYADDACGLGSTVMAGRPVDEGVSLTSGFLLDRIQGMMSKTCLLDPLEVGIKR